MTDSNIPVFRLQILTPDYQRGKTPLRVARYGGISDLDQLDILGCCRLVYCTFEQPYYGPEGLLQQDKSDMIPCKFFARRILDMGLCDAEHADPTNAFYPVRCEVAIEQVVLNCNGWYCVGNRMIFRNVRHLESLGIGYKPIPASAWEEKDIQIMEDGTVEAQVYLVREFRRNLLEVLVSMMSWNALEFGQLLHKHFGE